MRRESEPDLIASWTLVEPGWKLVANKAGATRLGFSAFAEIFEIDGRFPEYAAEVPEPAVTYLAQQVKVDATLFAKYDFLSRAAKYHRTQIREELGSRECTKAYQVELGRSLSGVIRTIETLAEASVLRSLREGGDYSTATGRMLAPAVRPD